MFRILLEPEHLPDKYRSTLNYQGVVISILSCNLTFSFGSEGLKGAGNYDAIGILQPGLVKNEACPAPTNAGANEKSFEYI